MELLRRDRNPATKSVDYRYICGPRRCLGTDSECVDPLHDQRSTYRTRMGLQDWASLRDHGIHLARLVLLFRSRDCINAADLDELFEKGVPARRFKQYITESQKAAQDARESA
jgi:hypothetical protein